MVSTRGVKFKFSEGEKVLCYEPDPTKAKVLYDSKVLEVIVNKDSRGRKCVEYLIHFQGWNSSWDRCVGEDYVLKDTDDNRRLQRTLSDKAQLQLRERKQQARRRKTSDRTSDGAEDGGNGGVRRKRRRMMGGRRRGGDEGSSGGDEEEDEDEEAEEVGGDDLSSEEDDEEEEDGGDEEEEQEEESEVKVPLSLSDNLKKLLDEDGDLITCKNKFIRLPASPNVVLILESFMKQYALNQIFPATMSPDKRKKQPRNQHHHHHSNGHSSCRPKDMNKAIRNLNLCKEVVDGVRIYFDHTLSGLLLYAQEKEQYEEEVASLASLSNSFRGDGRSGAFNKCTSAKYHIKQEQTNSFEGPQRLNSADFFNVQVKEEPRTSYGDSEKDTMESEEVCLKTSLKEEESFSQEKNANDKGNKGYDRSKESCSDYRDEPYKISRIDCLSDIKTDFIASFSGTFHNTMSRLVHQRVNTTYSRSVSVFNRFPMLTNLVITRSSYLPHYAIAASTSSCCSTPSCVTSNRPHSYHATPNMHERTASINSIGISPSESALLKRIMSWKLIPESAGVVNTPSQLYGAIHLVRLFVKLPDLLYAAGIHEKKLKVLLGYLQTFLEYLEEHTDWFGESHYKENLSTLM